MCQFSECPTGLLNLMLNHRDCPQSILMRIHRDSIILISLQNHLNDVQSRIIGAVDGFHDFVGTDVSMAGIWREHKTPCATYATGTGIQFVTSSTAR